MQFLTLTAKANSSLIVYVALCILCGEIKCPLTLPLAP